MAALIRGVDAAEAGLDREARQALGLLFFPGGAVEKVRNALSIRLRV
jgi:hypothetical protein